MSETSTCHICGYERPDDKISVLSKPTSMDGVTQNIRYCKDKPGCVEEAKTFDLFEGPPKY
jgi:hypothetical protein